MLDHSRRAEVVMVMVVMGCYGRRGVGGVLRCDGGGYSNLYVKKSLVQ
jgi:hypothetical protein